jgi:hypothetical protein
MWLHRNTELADRVAMTLMAVKFHVPKLDNCFVEYEITDMAAARNLIYILFSWL